MKTEGLTLLIPERADVERDAVAAAWERRGGTVVRLDRFWSPPAMNAERVRVYGNDTFCLVLQQKLDLELITPPDDLIFTVPDAGIRRSLFKQTIAGAPTLGYPIFAKPVTPKLFRARVYGSPDELAAECEGLPVETEILISEIVELAAESRCFVLDGRVLDCSVYEGDADPEAAAAFARAMAAAVSGPRSYVLDVGLIPGRGWAVVEFNAAWGAGLNGCNADLVLPAIAAASGPAAAEPGAAVRPPEGAGKEDDQMPRLTQIEAFSEEHRAAARAVAAAMAAAGRDPARYTAKVSLVARGLLEFYARHDCHPANWSGCGDACGRCCVVRYSPRTGRVLRITGIR